MNIQSEPSLWQLYISFFLMNLIYLITYLNIKRKSQSNFAWYLVLLFCLYAFWSSDYFSYEEWFYFERSEDFRDPLYYYIAQISFNSYRIFRLYVWGLALLCYFMTSKRLFINNNISIYIFSILFLLTFSYARASLGMAMYFLGLSFLIKYHKSKILSYCIGIIIITCSYFCHRSMLILIAMTPFLFVRLGKMVYILTILLSPVIFYVFFKILLNFSNGSIIIGGVEGFTEAGEGALDYIQVERNWKMMLLTYTHYFSIYIAFAYMLFKYLLSKEGSSRNKSILINISSFVVLISTMLFVLTFSIGMSDRFAARILFLSYIPICLLLAMLYQEGMCKRNILNRILFFSFLYSESYFIGSFLSQN